MMNPARSMCGWTWPSPARLPIDRTQRWAVRRSRRAPSWRRRIGPAVAHRPPGRGCGLCAARAASVAGLLPLPTMRSVRCPRSKPRSSMLVPHASLTRSPFRPNSTANAAWADRGRSAVNKKRPSSPRSMPWPLAWMDRVGGRTAPGSTRCARRCGRTGSSRTLSTSPIDRRGGQAAVLHPRPVQLDVGPRRGQQRQADTRRPLEELAKIGTVGVQRAAAVAGEERSRSELRFIERTVRVQP